MGTLVPLVVALPLVGGALMSALSRVRYTRLVDAFALAVAASVAGMAAMLLVASADETIVYWFGGWEPVAGIPVGISFVVQPFSAGFALLAAVVVVAALAFGFRYFEEAGTLYQGLVLVFLAAVVGFALSGDLFNMFVFFELMSVAAFALTGYRSDVAGPVQGAFNFAVTNTLGAIVVLFGIALLYGETNALNLGQIAEALAAGGDRGLVAVAFALVIAGFLVKAAAFPFHFWLADAYAVAPAPACVLFSAVMSDVGLYGVAEIWWTVFEPTLGRDEAAVRTVLVALGTATAAVGAVMCFLQRNLKRLLAFATISHAGLFLVGVGLLTVTGLAGTAIYVLADGLVKGGLFLGVGLMIHFWDEADELTLHGRGRGRRPALAAVFVAGGLALAALPPFGTYLGKSIVERAAADIGMGWVAWVLLVAEAVTGAAVLRAVARIWLGWGERDDPLLTTQREQPESDEPEQRERPFPRAMTVVASGLVAAGLAVGLIPGLAAYAQTAADAFAGRPPPVDAGGAEPAGGFHLRSLLFGIGSTAGALALAAAALFRGRLPESVRASADAVLRPPLDGLRRLHSGHVGDYVAWVTAGTAAIAVAFALTLS